MHAGRWKMETYILYMGGRDGVANICFHRGTSHGGMYCINVRSTPVRMHMARHIYCNKQKRHPRGWERVARKNVYIWFKLCFHFTSDCFYKNINLPIHFPWEWKRLLLIQCATQMSLVLCERPYVWPGVHQHFCAKCECVQALDPYANGGNLHFVHFEFETWVSIYLIVLGDLENIVSFS